MFDRLHEAIPIGIIWLKPHVEWLFIPLPQHFPWSLSSLSSPTSSVWPPKHPTSHQIRQTFNTIRQPYLFENSVISRVKYHVIRHSMPSHLLKEKLSRILDLQRQVYLRHITQHNHPLSTCRLFKVFNFSNLRYPWSSFSLPLKYRATYISYLLFAFILGPPVSVSRRKRYV